MAPNALQLAISDYLHEKRRLSSATEAQYRHVLERVWLPWCETEKIARPEQADDKAMQRFTEHLHSRAKPLSVHTIRTYIRGVRLFLTWAAVPKGRYKQPRAPERLLEVLTREEITAMENAATDERDRLIVRVLAESGVRVAELLGLRSSDLREDRHNRTFAIRVIGKGDREREVPLPKDVFLRLQHYAKHGSPGDYIFSAKRRWRGKFAPLTRSGIDRLMHQLAEEAGVHKRVYAHLFRHSYATHKLSRGMDSVVLQKIMGHSSLAMISTTYTHLNLTDKYEALLATLDRE